MAFFVIFRAFLPVICELSGSFVYLDYVPIVMSFMFSVDGGLSDRVNMWDASVTRRCGISASCY